MKKITINNVTYKSFAEAWYALVARTKYLSDPPGPKGYAVSYALARKRLSRGWEAWAAITHPPVPPTERRMGTGDYKFCGGPPK